MAISSRKRSNINKLLKAEKSLYRGHKQVAQIPKDELDYRRFMSEPKRKSLGKGDV